MLLEWIETLATPAPSDARALGHVREAAAIAARHRRLRAAWADHLDNCKRAVLDAIAACGARRRAVVLGSGLLLDTPLEALADGFDEVVLVDLVHPWPSRLKARRRGNVRLETRDLTGALAIVRTGEIPARPKPDFHDGDLVVSANVLSQLPLYLRERLEHEGRYGDEELDAFDRAVVQGHLDALAACSGRALLIADSVREIHDRGAPIEATDILFGVELPPWEREWAWDIAPRPEIHKDRDVRHWVVASTVPQKK